MIDHVVLLQARNGIDAQTLDRFAGLLADLPSEIDGIEYVRWGSSSSPEGLERGYTHGFVIGFADAAARDRYLPHPAHAPVIELAQEIAEQALVFDVTS